MNILKKQLIPAVAALALSFMAGGTSAATVTQLIHFDDASNGDSSYTTADGNFYFTPTNLASGNCAADTNPPGNGSCVHEYGNGIVTDMTRLTGNDDKAFSLLSFYVSVQGQGNTNFFKITDSDGVWHQYDFGSTYANMSDYPSGAAAGSISQNGKYIVDVSSLTGFDDITKVTWSASSTARIRIDCVVASFEGTTTDPYDSNTQCGLQDPNDPPGGVIPLPAGLPLMLSALGIGGLIARRKRKAA